MAFRKINADWVSGPGTVDQLAGGKFCPSITIDDSSGAMYLGSTKVVPPTAGAIRRHAPVEQVGSSSTYTFVGAPEGDEFFLLWNGLILNPADYSLSGNVVTPIGFNPQPGDSLFGLY